VGDKIEKNHMGGACSAYGGEERRVMAGKPEGMSPLGRPRRRWDDDINMDLQEGRCEVLNGIELAQDSDR